MSSVPILDVTRFMTEPSTCSYLAQESACLEYRVPWQLTSESYGELLCRGWRRFGNYVFRPQCRACNKCRPLRVDAKQFRASKSQRRTLKRNQHIEVSVGSPDVSDERIELFNNYHRDMTDRRGWTEHQISVPNYAEGFLGSDFDFAYEFQYRDEGRLVGVSLVDATACGLSSMYFYHDPAWRPLGPGTYSVLMEIEAARRMDVPHLYLGYWIHENQSMEYKARFRPHELLHTFVGDECEPVWTVPEPETSPYDV